MTRKRNHEKCIEVLEKLEHLQIIKRHYVDGINSYANQFKWLKEKYERKVIIIDLYADRLEQQYSDLVCSP